MSNYEKNDNTKVTKFIKRPLFKRTISSEEKELMKQLGYIWDGEKWVFMGTISQGEGSPNNKTLLEKAKNYWKFSGASDRWKTSWKSGQNPIKGALDVGLGYTHPILAGANTLYDMYNAYNLLSSSQGLAKTWGLIRSGNLGKAAVSAAGDALVTSDLIPGMPEIPSVRPVSIPEIRIPNRGDFTGDVVIPAMNITDNPIDMSEIRSALNTNSANRGVTRENLRTLSNSTDNVLTQLSPSLDNFNSRLLSLINEATSSQEQYILQLMSNGNWENAHRLWGNALSLLKRKYEDLIKIHPDNKYLNNSNHYDNLQQLIAILKLRHSFKYGTIPEGRDVVTALGNNPYDDNPLIEELGRSNLTKNYDILPSETREMFEGPWNSANNHTIVEMMKSNRRPYGESNYAVPENHPYEVLKNMFIFNSDLPVEYRHFDTRIYDDSYPLKYYKGDQTPDGLTSELLLSNGLLGNTIGLFTDEQLGSISQDVFDNFLRRSWNQNVEGGHGVEFWSKPRNAETALEFLLTRGSAEAREDMRQLLLDMQKSLRSGYVNFPHGLSIDSWPIWEAQSFKLRNKTVLIPINLLENSSHMGSFIIKEGTPYVLTNSLGLGNRIEASPELLKYIQDNKGLTIKDFEIKGIGNEMFNIEHGGTKVGTLKLLSSDEALEKFNRQRRLIYRKNPELNPGDAKPYRPYQYYVPFSPRLVKKEGGKLNVKLGKRNTN